MASYILRSTSSKFFCKSAKELIFLSTASSFSLLFQLLDNFLHLKMKGSYQRNYEEKKSSYIFFLFIMTFLTLPPSSSSFTLPRTSVSVSPPNQSIYSIRKGNNEKVTNSLSLFNSNPLLNILRSNRSSRISNRMIDPISTFNRLPSSSLSSSTNENSIVASESEPNESDKQALYLAVFNLVKACVGSGVLALSSGVAALGDTRSAYVLF